MVPGCMKSKGNYFPAVYWDYSWCIWNMTGFIPNIRTLSIILSENFLSISSCARHRAWHGGCGESLVPCPHAHALVERTLVWICASIKVGRGSPDEREAVRPIMRGKETEDKGLEAPLSHGLWFFQVIYRGVCWDRGEMWTRANFKDTKVRVCIFSGMQLARQQIGWSNFRFRQITVVIVWGWPGARDQESSPGLAQWLERNWWEAEGGSSRETRS